MYIVSKIIVYNKIDNCADKLGRIVRRSQKEIVSARVSSASGAGIEELIAAIEEKISGKKQFLTVRLEPSQGKLRSVFYEWKAVCDEKVLDNGDFLLRLGLNGRELRILKQFTKN